MSPLKNPSSARKDGQRLPDGLSELVRLVLAYAKQETIEPVRAQVRHLGRALAGALLLAVGTVLLALGLVRALQVELGAKSSTASVFGAGDHLSGNLSWVPYMAGAVLCLAVSAGCVALIVRRSRQ
ncbi:MAG: hypothetical protein ACP5VR_03380 [Acidimicrobiales bacterium]